MRKAVSMARAIILSRCASFSVLSLSRSSRVAAWIRFAIMVAMTRFVIVITFFLCVLGFAAELV